MSDSGYLSRKSNFELLRIVAVFFVLSCHYVTKGGIVNSDDCLPQKVSLIFWIGGKLGVSIFALITGYFSRSRTEYKKIIRVWGELLFFSIISLLLFSLFDRNAIDTNMIISTFLPVSKEVWWYMSNYIFILALSPFLYQSISALNKIDQKKLICILLLGFSIIPTFIFGAKPFFSNVGWLIVLYFIGYYLKDNFNGVSSKIWCGCFALSVLFMWLSEIIFEKHEGIETSYFLYMFRIPMLVAAISIFLLFRNMPLNYNKVINFISKGAMGVYLLHDGLFFRQHWYDFIRTQKVYDSWLFLIHMIISDIVLFILGSILDRVYLVVLWGKFKKLIDKVLV